MSQSQQIKEITDKLQQGIEDLFESENYKNYLKTMSKFTSYSLNNTLLISMQMPSATTVAGYNTWKQVNRQVVKGAKAIKIIAPCIYKREDVDISNVEDRDILNKDAPETKKVLAGFRVVNVFDYSQTKGEPLPEITHKLDSNIDEYTDFMDALKQFSPVPISFKNVDGSANGYYHLIDKNIVIDEGMSQAMNCKTTIHEISHAILHDEDTGLEKDASLDRKTKEVQAESVAYVVSNYFGIDTSEYSFGYISGWSSGKELKELKASLETIRQTAQMIIDGVEQKLDAIKKSKNICIENSQSKKCGIRLMPTSKSVHSKTLKY